jgi:predicted  nucleic acid-binding Zn-ribbon protein
MQVRLAAADSRRQLAEERAEELERKVQQLRANVAESSDRREAAERQLRQVGSFVQGLMHMSAVVC